MRAPFARGVTHLMYVGDVPDSSQNLRNAAVAIGGIVAVFGKDLGVSKTARAAAGAVALGALLLR